jgi:hypothetical protein
MVACNVGVVAFKPYDTRAKFLASSKPFLTLKHDLGERLPCVNHGEKFQGVILVAPSARYGDTCSTLGSKVCS